MLRFQPNTNSTVTLIAPGNSGQITFNVAYYYRAFVSSTTHPLAFLNRYWASLPVSTQQQIFKIYETIGRHFDNVYIDGLQLREQDYAHYQHQFLQTHIRSLLAHHPFDAMKLWAQVHPEYFPIPGSIPTRFIYDMDRKNSQNKTYIQSEYLELLTFSLQLRCLLPIWGQFIAASRNQISARFLEVECLNLLDVGTLESLPVTKKLETYIMENAAAAKKRASTDVMNGMCADDIADRLLALIYVRNLVVAEIHQNTDNEHLISFLYKCIQGHSEEKPSGKPTIKDKTVPVTYGDTSASSQTSSVLSRYRLRADISVGEICELEQEAEDLPRLLYQIDPTSPLELLTEFRTGLDAHVQPLAPAQITLLRWVLQTDFPTEGIRHLSDPLVKNLAAISQTFLWNQGFHYLAVLQSAQAFVEEQAVILTSGSSTRRISDALLAELDRRYPYRVSERARKSEKQSENTGIVAINKLYELFLGHAWRPLLSPERILHVFRQPVSRVPFHPDFKNQLAQLLVHRVPV